MNNLGEPHEAPLQEAKTVRHAPARPSVSSLERSSSVAGVIERRRAAQSALDEVLSGLSPAESAMPRRVTGEVGFILHARDWSETSLLLDVLTAGYGRVFIAAKGARRPSSQYRGLLTAFAPLRLTWSGSKEVKNLIRADWMGTMVPLTGEALLSGFYVNELILKLTEREECHCGLFDAYVTVIHDLASGDRDAVQPALRRFERRLLTIAGWAPVRTGPADARRHVVRAGVIEGLPEDAPVSEGERIYTAAEAEAVVSADPIPASAMRAARDILRELIQFHLDGRVIHSRRILAELNRLPRD